MTAVTSVTSSGFANGSTSSPRVDVVLPSDATGVVRITDRRSKVSARVAMVGATPARGQLREGFTVYAGAAPSSGDVFHRVSELGDEDFVRYERRPAEESLRYQVALEGAAGLRLFEGVLEVLDNAGAPRLRVARPIVTDARGAQRFAELSVEGCKVDSGPLPAWSRSFTRLQPANAGANASAACALVVSWRANEADYPMVVDPSWQATSTMVDKRSFHAVAPLKNLTSPTSTAIPVLVTGGFNEAGVALSSVEIYEPLTQTFSLTSPMATARGAHTATAVPQTGEVVVAGGGTGTVDVTQPQTFISASPTASVEIYDQTSGLFSGGLSLSTGRVLHTATALSDNVRVVIVGGSTTASGDIFTSAGEAGPATITPTGPMVRARFGHAAASLTSGAVLITGGFQPGPTVLASTESFCPPGDCAHPVPDGFLADTPLVTARAFHTATALNDGSGDVVVAGGVTAFSAGFDVVDSVEIFHLGAFAQDAGALLHMTTPRAFHTATALVPSLQLTVITNPGKTPVDTMSGKAEIMVAGGSNGTVDLPSAEAYLPLAQTFGVPASSGAPLSMVQGRRAAAAIIVNAGQSLLAGNALLVSGGTTAGTSTNTVEVFFKTNGDACSSDNECQTGHCAYGVCCDTACEGACYTCVASQQQPPAPGDGTCSATRLDTPVGVKCDATFLIEVHYACDGNGNAFAGPGTHSCLPSACEDNQCRNYCDNDTKPCASNGWCDFSQLQDGGAGTGGSGAGGSSPVDAGTGAGGSDAGSSDAGPSDAGGSGGSSSASGSGGAGGSSVSSSSASSTSSSSSSSGASSSSSGSSADAGPHIYGTCQFKGAPAAAAQCTEDSHCLAAGTGDAGLCIDGYCCNLPCGSQCEACDVQGFEGTCTQVTGAVHSDALHPRAACNGVGVNVACEGTCPGPGTTAVTACTYPDGGTVAKALDCVDMDGGAVVQTQYPCDSDGGNTSATSDCGGYRCLDAHACRSSCTVDTDCATDNICVISSTAGAVGSCKQLVNALCDGRVTLRRTVEAGGNEVCANHYACPVGATECLTSCEAVQDCAPGYLCDDTHVCRASLAQPALPACSVREAAVDGPDSDGLARVWAALCALALAVGTRARRARARASRR